MGQAKRVLEKLGRPYSTGVSVDECATMPWLTYLRERPSFNAGTWSSFGQFRFINVLCNTAGAVAVSVLWLTNMPSRLQPANFEQIKMRSI